MTTTTTISTRSKNLILLSILLALLGLLKLTQLHSPNEPFITTPILTSYEKVNDLDNALGKAGFKKKNLIIMLDLDNRTYLGGLKTFKQKMSANGKLRNLNEIQNNPYHQSLLLIERSLEKYDIDGIIPTYGFDSNSLKSNQVFRLNFNDRQPHGVHEALFSYEEWAQSNGRHYTDNDLGKETFENSKPITLIPAINKSIEIVKEKGTFHILAIVTSGNLKDIASHLKVLNYSSLFPLAIILFGVGDGPFEALSQLDYKVDNRLVDNVHFVNLTEIMEKKFKNSWDLENYFNKVAMKQIPDHFDFLLKNNLLGKKYILDVSSQADQSNFQEIINHLKEKLVSKNKLDKNS